MPEFFITHMNEFCLPVLNYSYDQLEPHINSKTMEIHHTKHHQTYINNLNNELSKTGCYEKVKLVDILLNNNTSQTIKNNAGGHYNHSLFWTIMGPVSNKSDIGHKLGSSITMNFGSLDYLMEIFNDRALKVFGSGWVWLVGNKDGKLEIFSTQNQDNPLMYNRGIPFLCLDVWEHAYYLQYKNMRKDYIHAWWNVVDWKNVNSLYEKFVLNNINMNVKHNGTVNLIIKQ